MTAKEYLQQAYRLDQKINSDLEGAARLREMEQKINAEIDQLVDLKEQIRTVIDAVPDTDERMVLTYRYLHNMTWEEIGSRLYADERTIRRWHGKALENVKVPDDAIII